MLDKKWDPIKIGKVWPLLALLLIVFSLLLCTFALSEDLEACMSGKALQTPTLYDDFLESRVPRLQIIKCWWSQQPRTLDLTVVTALTASRLTQLQAQCQSWKGPLSAAAYIPVQEDLQEYNGTLSADSQKKLQAITRALEIFHERMEAENNCQLDLLLAYEVVGDAAMEILMPINTLRNYALLQARTSMVAMIDVDLLLSRGLFEDLSQPPRMAEIHEGCRNGNVYILPAFETLYSQEVSLAYQLAETAIQGTKQQLKVWVDNGQVFPFASKKFVEGHRPTNFSRWFSTHEDYHVEYVTSFEPWFIIDRHLNPFYDCRFRGYGWNKVTQVTHVHHRGFRFVVLRDGFIVHRQHERSQAGSWYLQGIRRKASNSNLCSVVGKFRSTVQKLMQQQTYEPLVDSGVQECLETLPWWRNTTSWTCPISRDPLETVKGGAALSGAVAVNVLEP